MGEKTDKKAKGKLNTMVLDSDKGFALEHVEQPPGRKWHYGRGLVSLVKREKENGVEKLTPIELPLEMGESPEKLYRALFWEREAVILFTLHSPLLERLKTIGMYILIVLLLILIYMVASSMGG